MTWQTLQQYAACVQLQPTYWPVLQEFFEQHCDKEFFDSMVARFLGDFPEAEIIAHYPAVADQNKFILLCAIASYPQLENFYYQHGYPEVMLHDLAGDLAVWVDTLYPDLGYPGMPYTHLGWHRAAFDGRVKQCGRLQYNTEHNFFAKLSFYRKPNGQIDQRPALLPDNPPHPDLSYLDKVVNIHIPALGPLKRQACIASLRQMTEFMAEFEPDYDYRAVVCYSWLLDPTFKTLLAEKSNIRQFQNLGYNYKLPEIDQTEVVKWRIWGDKSKTLPLAELPQDNSIQRAVVAHLQKGGNFTEGGLIIWRDQLPELFKEL